MYTRHHYQQMADYQLPELLRTPLDELALQIKVCGCDEFCGSYRASYLRQRPLKQLLGDHTKVAPMLAKAMDPPPQASVDHALTLLRKLGALDDRECLTSLG